MKPNIAIVGVGLVGGSLGMVLRRKHLARMVTGVFRRSSQIPIARKLGAIGRGTTDLIQGVRSADIIFLCTSPDEIVRIAKQIMPHLKKGAILTDVGSTKADLVRRIERVRRRDIAFIGGHPLAGLEKSGVRFARARLFEKATWVLTRSVGASNLDRARLKRLLLQVCKTVHVMSPSEHDERLAFTSHLPHAVAAALVSMARPGHVPFIASGFRDMTRIAAAGPALWREVFLTNDRLLAGQLRVLQRELARLERVVHRRKGVTLLRYLSQAKRRRERLG